MYTDTGNVPHSFICLFDLNENFSYTQVSHQMDENYKFDAQA